MKRFIRKLIVFILLLIVIVAGLVFSAGYLKYKQVTQEKPIKAAAADIMNIENFTELEDISPTFVNAMVAVEDRRFYKHKGIDVIGVVRAIRINFKNREAIQGGSSITQQLAKNMYFMKDYSLTRKIAESIIAVELEKTYSKEEILELYFNTIYYGSGYYNIYAASTGYFNELPSDLSDYEATLLAGIPNAPSVYSLNNKPELAKKRQKTVVEAMLDEDMLTQTEADEILSEQ